jgi:hypothetical protein
MNVRAKSTARELYDRGDGLGTGRVFGIRGTNESGKLVSDMWYQESVIDVSPSFVKALYLQPETL